MVVVALAPRCPAGPSACKVSGTSPRGTADQGRIKALGGEGTARVEGPSLCCTQGCLQGTVAVQGDSRCCHITVMGRWKESSTCSTHCVRLTYPPWVQNWVSTQWGWGKSWGEPHAVGTQNHAHGGIGGAGSQHRGDTRGLAKKTQSRVKGTGGR